MLKKRKELSIMHTSHAVPISQISNRPLFRLSLFLCILVTVGLVTEAWGGKIKSLGGDPKKTFWDIEFTFNQTLKVKSYMEFKFIDGWGDLNNTIHVAQNFEVVTFKTVSHFKLITIYNVFPDLYRLPQPIGGQVDLYEPIDVFFVMMVDTGEGIGPLPDGVVLEEASLIGSSGEEYTAEITPIYDLNDLPTSSTYDLEITWDLSDVAQTTGNFFLSKVILPNAHELIGPVVPATSRWGLIVMALLLLTVGIIVIVRLRRRIAM